jgi:photosystem II stability/assembly factor-like uncharacterized protein
MKSIIQLLVSTVVLSGILSVSHSQRSSWLKINSPVNTNLRNLFFADSLTGWASGASGRIINTTDGGVSWNIQNSNVASFVTDIFFLNENFGWAITVKDQSPFNTVILKTTNGGNEWITEDFYDMNAFMTTIFFLDSLNGFIGGSYISKTTNGGSTWEKATIDSSMFSTRPIFKFRFYNKNFGYACGGATDQAGVIWRTTNGGLNWSAQGLGPDEIFDLFIIDSLNAISLSGDPEEFYPTGNIKTTNAGETWTYEALPFYSLSFAIDFRTASEAWSASGYKFLWTSDSGLTWNEQGTPQGAVIYGLQFTDKRTGYAVGEDGTILKFITPPVEINVEESLPPSGFRLNQNYPNPFNPSTKISWQSSTGSWQTLTIYDMLGNKIATPVDEYKPAGSYEITFDASDLTGGKNGLSSGIYFYSLKAVDINSNNSDKTNFTSTNKMLLLK